MFNDETLRAALVAAIHAQGSCNNMTDLISETVDALIDADRKLRAYEKESLAPNSEAP